MVKIGLVLSSGGARGLAHLGVLDVLQKNNIKIDAIAGCSMGSIVGAMYASHMKAEETQKELLDILRKKDIFDVTFSTKGIFKGEKFEQYIKRYFGKDTFEDLNIPLTINAVDIETGNDVLFTKGNLSTAVIASISYPGLMEMRNINGKWCVDGALSNPVPVHTLKGVDYLIVVDVAYQYKKIDEKSTIKDILLKSTYIMQKHLAEKSIALCTTKCIVIRPPVSEYGIFDFADAKKIIDAGANEAQKAIDNIKKDIEGIK